MDFKKVKDFYSKQIAELKVTGNSFLIEEIKNSSLNEFNSASFPSTKDEEWKYTDITPLLQKEFFIAKKVKDKINIEKFIFNNFPQNLIVFIDGIFSEEYSKYEPSNFQIKNLTSFTNDDITFLQDYFDISGSKKNIFTIMNAAFAGEGFFIYVPDNTNVELPLQILNINGYSNNALITPRYFIYVGKNSSLKIISNNRHFSDNSYFVNNYFDLRLARNSHLDFYNILNENSFSYNFTNILMERESNLNHFSISLNGKFIRNDLTAELNDENIECNLNGLYLSKSDNLVDNHTEVIHAKPNSNSNEIYKGILTDKSHGVFNGKIIVAPQAQKTNAFQSNRNILLSKDAKVDTKPQLEIFADDVKCSHGATVGSLDENSKFYIKSRGIPEDIANKMLLKAFACEIIEKIEIKDIRKYLTSEISNLLTEKKSLDN
ncbi:MAG: Fe-S cluster assembly protein SufD [Ignavibacteriales bacterium]|nr:Fe-S cluster assembly protein SufD [Ignavibacteriales bacterium]